MKMNLKDKLNLINNNREQLPAARRRTLVNYKKMYHNLKEEGGRIGGESHVSPNGLKHAEAWADKIIAAYKL